MYKRIWKECHASVCEIRFLTKSGNRLTSLTGFRIKDFIITNELITKFEQPDKVQIRFVREDGYTDRASKLLTYKSFQERIYQPGDKEIPGYVIIRINDKEFRDIPSLKCSRKISQEIGQRIAILGYNNFQNNLALKTGIISSFINKHIGFNYMQVDAVIQHGNAGSPLITTDNMEVIGVIGYHLAIVIRAYRMTMDMLNQNIEMLNKAVGKYNFDDVDPFQALVANQNQIKKLAKEFFKTFEVRVGYAVELCNLIDYCPDLDTANDFEERAEE